MAGELSTDRRSIAGAETFYRYRPGEGTLTVFAHGNPTDSADWVPFMERCRGPVLALDMPGFGRSGPVADPAFDGSMHALADWHTRALGELGVGEHNLVVHDWGGLALIGAQRSPERVRRLVVIDAVPLLAGYRWHWIARIWRRRGLGEAFNRTATRGLVGALTRQARPGYQPLPEEMIDAAWRPWRAHTAQAVLALYRSADPGALEAAGSRLARLRCPALVVWGREDPYVGPENADRYAEALPEATVEIYDDAGHWPWLDRPEIVERVTGFLEG